MTQPVRAVPLDVFACPLEGTRLIEASAGTGKTWNICGLYLRLVLERALEVQQILVVTFTNAATAELRERIRERMVQVLAVLRGRGPAADAFADRLLASLRERRGLRDEEMANRLEAAIGNFDEAAIFTIHGFSQRALADAPFAAGLPLQLELLADDGELRCEIAGDFWRRRVAAPHGSAALAGHLLAQKDSPQRFAQLLRRHAGKPLSRLLWPDGCAGEPQDLDRASLQAAHERARLLWQAQRAEIVGCVTEALPRLHGASYKPATVQTAVDSWDALLAPSSAPAAPPRLEKLELLTADSLAAKLKKNQAPCREHPFFAAAAALLAEHARLERLLQQERLRLLRQLVEEGPGLLRAAKRERRVVAFDDMLFNLHERLAGTAGPRLAGALRQRFPAALIDEFQDTDPLQFSIFDAVYGGGRSLLFLVGDPKQAIYSFRNADLHTYLQARGAAQAEYTLAHNQRSTPGLLAALNALFAANPQAFMLPGLAYGPVAPGDRKRALLRDVSEPRAALQLWSLAPGLDGDAPDKPAARRQAIAACAGEIARLLAAAQRGDVTLDGRPLAAGDMAVLVRSHAQGSAVRLALQALGVGSVELSQASVFHSQDAQDLERVLAAVLEPSREGLVRAALATELMGLDADAIEALGADQPAMLGRLADFAADRERWLAHGPARMLREMFAREQVSRRMLARPDGERRLTNLRHLLECLHEAAREHATPEALLRWLRLRREDEAGDEAAQLRLDSDRNLVQIVTIHKSKGLEYPIVFCPFLWDGHPGGGADGLPGVEYHDDEGRPVIDFRAVDADVRERLAIERAAENLRLIYVALTRAVHRCYLTVGCYRVRTSHKECTRGPLNWLAAGSGHEPGDWLKNEIPAATIEAAWQRLAQEHQPHIALDPIPQGPGAPLRPEVRSPEQFAARQPPAVPAAWRIGSYSSLAHGAPSEAAADHDVRVRADRPSQAADAASVADDDILRFPRGTRAGETLHAVFERVEFADPAAWPAAIDAALRDRPPRATVGDARGWAAMVRGMLAEVMAAPLSGGHRLEQIGRGKRLTELEFSLPCRGLDAQALAALLQRHGYPLEALAFGRLEGYLRGFIDLVYEHDGRWYLLDWKSNHLGWSPADYDSENLRRAMDRQGYHLQYLLYTVALHRYLRQRLRDYDYERHFGGVHYLFVRGVRRAWTQGGGSTAGVYFDRPGWPAIEALDAMLGHRAGALA